MKFPNGKCIGTGWLIGPKTVMTAGHSVFDPRADGWAKSIKVIPRMNGNIRPYGSRIATKFRSISGWTVDNNH
jgi:V8-like Glu-specific endopeptidase